MKLIYTITSSWFRISCRAQAPTTAMTPGCMSRLSTGSKCWNCSSRFPWAAIKSLQHRPCLRMFMQHELGRYLKKKSKAQCQSNLTHLRIFKIFCQRLAMGSSYLFVVLKSPNTSTTYIAVVLTEIWITSPSQLIALGKNSKPIFLLREHKKCEVWMEASSFQYLLKASKLNHLTTSRTVGYLRVLNHTIFG